MISYNLYMHKILRYSATILVILTVLLTFPRSSSAIKISDYKVPSSFSFKRDLRFGTSTSPDVMWLQNVLNMSTTTQVATTGPGSNLALTNYFGTSTQIALDKFQKKYAVDIAYEVEVGTSSITYGTTTASPYVATTTATYGSSTFVVSSSTVDMYTRAVLNKVLIIYNDARAQYSQYTEEQLQRMAAAIETAEAVAEADMAAETEEVEQVVGAVEAIQAAQKKTADKQNKDNGDGSFLSQIPSLTDKPHEAIYKTKKLMFKYSPQGQLLKLIGGQELVNQVFGYTPAGTVGKLTGQGGSGAAGAGAIAGGIAGAAGGGRAITGTGLQNFGGMTTAMVNCTCSFNILLYVQDVRGATLPLIYQPGATILYSYFRPTSGVKVLGQYVTGGQCLIYAGTTCTTGGSPIGTMVQLGTSLY